MISFQKSGILIVFTLLHLLSLAQNQGLNNIDTFDIKKHLSFLSSDSLQGRAFDTPNPGLDIAAEYIRDHIKMLGLKDGANNYFQTVPIHSVQFDTENTFLKVDNKNGKVDFQTDSIIGFSEMIYIEDAEIVFACFGFRDEKTGYEDFNGIDVKGKLLVFSTGTPERFREKEQPRWNNQLETSKIKYALSLGPEGVILVNNPLDEGNSIYNRIERWKKRGTYSLKEAIATDTDYGFVFTTSSQADKILGEQGKLFSLLDKISKKEQPGSFLVKGKKATLKFKNLNKEVAAKNIIGVVEGSDEELKNECVVFMAHYDHLGINQNGEVYNGADDNGSGVVTLMELAEAFSKLEEKPKRSIVFLWVTAEEVGMLGSRFYAENPVFPMQKTVTCINIDMDGRVYQPRDSVWKDSPKIVKDFDGLYTLTNDYWPGLKEINTNTCKTLNLIPDYSLPTRFLRSSDHVSFHEKGVPIINYATGYHADYHKVTDEISLINFEKIKRVTELCFLVGIEIANKKNIEIVNP